MQLAELYQTRAEYNFKRLERIEHAPRRIPALSTVRLCGGYMIRQMSVMGCC